MKTINMEILMVKTSTGKYLIDTNTIIRIEASSNYSKLYFSNGKILVTAKFLKWFVERLQSACFTRLHRSHLINNGYLQLYKSSCKTIQLQNGKIIPVSRRRKKYVLQKFAAACLFIMLSSQAGFSQNVGIGTVLPAAKLHIKGSADTSQLIIEANGTQSNTKPLLKLRNSTGADLLWIHSDNSLNSFVGYNTGRFNNANNGATGNSFFGSHAADSTTSGANNTAIGMEALQSNTAGNNATAIGYQAMRYTNSAVGSFTNTNIAVGYQALRGSIVAANNTGTGNTTVGYQSMLSNSSGFNNTATGRGTLYSNTTGDNNTAIGYYALYDNTTGLNNTATGFQSLYNNVDGDRNTAIGTSSLLSNQGGNNGTAIGYGAMQLANNTASSYTNTNVAVGYEALRGSVSASNNTGGANSAVGYQALYSNSSGDYNTANGYHALYSNNTGTRNTAFGYVSLTDNNTGSQNTALGWQTLNSNTTGEDNTASGANTMRYNSTGSKNTTYGTYALLENIAGSNGTAIGYGAMSNYNNTATPFTNFNVAVGYEALSGGSPNPVFNTGNSNTAIGYQSLSQNSSGNYNMAAGTYALGSNLQGDNNTAVGMYSLYNTNSNQVTALGYSAGSAYSNFSGCTFIGYNAETNALGYNNATAIGYNAIVNASDKVRVGNTSVTSIGGQVGWTTFSDGRFKSNITEDVSGLDFILKLRPVTYTTDITALNKFIGVDEIRQIKENRGEKISSNDVSRKQAIRYSGLIAQDVEKVARELGFAFSGVDAPLNAKDIYGIRYAEFVVPLVKAVQELNQKSEFQLKMIAELLKEIELLKAKK